MTDRIEAIERLGRLLDEKKVNLDEFEILKKGVIDSQSSVAAIKPNPMHDRSLPTGNGSSSGETPPGVGIGVRATGPTRSPFDSFETKSNFAAGLLLASSLYWLIVTAIALDSVLPSRFFFGLSGPGILVDLQTWYPLLILATGSSFVVWSYAAHANLTYLGRRGLRYADHAAVWWWLVPIGNLFMPYRVNFETVRGTVADPDDDQWAAHALPAAAIWWASAFVAGILLNGLAGYLLETGFSSREGAIHALGPMSLSVAAYAAARLVFKTTFIQLWRAGRYPLFIPSGTVW